MKFMTRHFVLCIACILLNTGCTNDAKVKNTIDIPTAEDGLRSTEAFRLVLKSLVSDALVDYRLSGHRLPEDAINADYVEIVCQSLALQCPAIFQLSVDDIRSFANEEFNEEKDWAELTRLLINSPELRKRFGILENYVLGLYQNKALKGAELAVARKLMACRLPQYK